MAPNGKKDGSESRAGESGLTIESSGNPGVKLLSGSRVPR